MKTNLLLLFSAIIAVSCQSNSMDNMVYVKGGWSLCGTASTDADPDENHVRTVYVGDFYISRYEVTQKEWKDIMGYNPSIFRGDKRPVECVSWDMAQLFIKKLNKRTGRHFRLPTQEEWEYAARSGANQDTTLFSGGNDLQSGGWFCNNSDDSTHNVGSLLPNSIGLYDMTGNVHEWCDGLYDAEHYSQDTNMNKDISYWNIRVFKGGSWASDERHCRISNINYNSRDMKNYSLGLRLAEDR